MKAVRTFVLSNYFWPFLFGTHFLVLFFLYLKFGINFSNESEKYLAIATRLNLTNYRDELHYLWGYSFYISFLALCLKVGFSVYVILLFQYMISLIGFYLFYKFIVSQSFFQEVYSRICITVIATCPIILYWQLTFYTESLFPALVMISTYYFFRPKVNPLVAAILLSMLMFCRPVGVFYVIALVYVIMKSKKLRFAAGFLYCSLALVFVIVLFFLPVHYNDFALPIYQGSVICGFPVYPRVIPPGDYSLFEVYILFVKEHGFPELLTIIIKKTATFFTVTRSYYSVSHNLINSVYYIFIIGGLWGFYRLRQVEKTKLFVGYFSGVLTGSLFIVALIYNEWSERFIVPLLPFFILLTFVVVNNLKPKTVV